jgi:hypothetical protein
VPSHVENPAKGKKEQADDTQTISLGNRLEAWQARTQPLGCLQHDPRGRYDAARVEKGMPRSKESFQLGQVVVGPTIYAPAINQVLRKTVIISPPQLILWPGPGSTPRTSPMYSEVFTSIPFPIRIPVRTSLDS